MATKIYYDKEAKILYIVLREGPVEDTEEVADGIFMELNEKGEPVGIEIWGVEKVVYIAD